MSQRTALIIAVMVTSFLLVAVGGVSATIANRPAAGLPTDTSAPTLAPTETPLAGVDPTLVAQREAEYQQALADANQQLQQAYQMQQALADKLAAIPPTATPRPVVIVQQPAATATSAQPQYPITPEMAAQLALNASPGAILQGTPELVLFEGSVAYEVLLDRGKVYIDATTGAVLYNGAPAPQPPSNNGGNGSGGGSVNPPPSHSSSDDDSRENEHEEEHHEEHESEDHGGGDD
jgi:uncharacterized membrane protein